MELQRISPLLATWVAAFALIYPISTAARTPEKPLTAAAASPMSQEHKLPEQRPTGTEFPTAERLVSEFLDGQPEASLPLDGQVSQSPYTIDFLIATAPDPISSPLPSAFDSFIESLESAAEAAGYTLDRFALPWSSKAAEEKPPNWHRTIYESQPGLILFRDPTLKRLLLVFIIGETPTSGIHKQAMGSALDEVAQFYPWDAAHSRLPANFPAPESGSAARGTGGVSGGDSNTGAATIRIMGPAFSGSAASLRFVLDSWSASHSNAASVRFQVISGTATAIDAADFTQAAQGRTTFQAAVPPDSATLQAIACYIERLGYSKIAVLTEGNTAYGQNFKKQSAPANVSGSKSAEGCGDAQTPPEILSLPFPMHISRLRAESSKASPKNGQADPGKAAPGPMVEETGEEPREVLPSFSDLSIQSAELRLANLLSTIAREQYSYVGIVATDVRDVIFLARQVREHCPATILFTLNSDLLYAYPAVNSATRGMIVITPYPLFNLEQLWTYAYGGGKSRLQFANQAAEGVYNATLALLHQDAKMVDYGKPLSIAANAPSEGYKPSLWVMAIGNQETLPIRLLPWSDASNYTYSASATGFAKAKVSPGRPSVGRGIYVENTVVAMIVFTIFLCAFCVVLIVQYWQPGKAGSGCDFALLGDPASSAYWSECRLFLLCACLSVLAFYLLAVVDFCLPFMTGQMLGSGIETTDTPKVAISAALATMLVALLAVHKLMSAFRKAPPNYRGSAPEVLFFVLFSCGLIIVLVLFLAISWLQHVRAYPATGLFTHLRSFDLRGGLSPLLPFGFVAAGACLWSLCSFRRLRVLDVVRSTATPEKPHSWLNFLSLDVLSFGGVRELENSIKHILESSSVVSLPWYLALMGVSIAVGHYFFATRLVRALESRTFYWLFEAAFIIVYWALLTEFLRLIFTWRSLHLLLQRLSWHPLLAAFKRYREKRPNLPKMNLTHLPSSFAALESSVNQAGLLVKTARRMAVAPDVSEGTRESLVQSLPDWETQFRTAQSNLNEALRVHWADGSRADTLAGIETVPSKRARHLQGDWRRSLKCRGQAHHAMHRLAQSVAKVTEGYWSSHHAEGSPSTDVAGAKEFFDLVEEFIVSRVVNFLAIVFPSLQNLGYFVLAGLLLMLLAVTSYPFQPRNEFLFFNWIVILSFAGTVFWIFLQMDRDTVLSLLNDSSPGQVSFSWELVFRSLLYVAVPLLALLGAQFPESLRQILTIFTAAPGSS